MSEDITLKDYLNQETPEVKASVNENKPRFIFEALLAQIQDKKDATSDLAFLSEKAQALGLTMTLNVEMPNGQTVVYKL